MNWKVWTFSALLVHLFILLVCLVLVKCDWWPSWHHRRVENLSLGARTRIKQVVEESWEELLNSAKDLLDARLEDGGDEYLINDSQLT